MLLNTPVVHFGQHAPAFELSDPDGTRYTLNALMGKKGLLVAFICNHCPYVKAIIGRFVQDAKVLQNEGVGVVAIMPNDYIYVPDDSPENMKKFSVQHGLTFPYLVDLTQNIAKAYGAVCTPDFFGYNAQGELQYRGRLDNITMNAEVKGRVPELVNAMRQVATTGQGPESQMPSMGCSIKWRE